jgi:hypothetical protein
MNTKSSFATAVVAAVAAIGLSAAFQPAPASASVIDNFTVPVTATASGGSGVFSVSASDGTFGPFNQRTAGAIWSQNTTRANRTVSAISTGTGVGRLQLFQSSTSSGSTNPEQAYSEFLYENAGGAPVNLQTLGTAFSITTLATSTTGDFRGFVDLYDEGGVVAQYTLSTMWAPNTTTTIPFTVFTDASPTLDLTKVQVVYVGIRNQNELVGATLNSATAEFASIAVVPEPTQIVSLAGIGLAYGAFRLRKLRRDRGTSEAAKA